MTRGDCESIRPLISAALDGELDEDEFVRLSEHLASCADCHQAYQDYSQLRDELRSSPTPAPPSDLTRSIRRETVEKPPPPLVVQLASRAGLRFGATTVAASLVILFAFGILGVLTYDRNSPPTIEASSPAQETGGIQDWPLHQPIEIQFSKPMNKQSVQQNLRVQPTSELNRLPQGWEGNTLVLGRSESESVLLKPRTDYTIAILEDAEDVNGNQLGKSFELSLRTSSEQVAVNTPPTEEDETEATEDTPTQDQREASPSAEESPTRSGGGSNGNGQDDGAAVGGEDVDESDVADEEAVPTRTSPPQESQDEPDDEATPPPDDEQDQEQPADERDQDQETPEPTATPKPTATPSPNPEPTSTPGSDPTTEPTEQEEPAIASEDEDSTPTPETIPVRGPFGEVYWGNQSVQDALGPPTREANSFIAAEQDFQHGMMFRRFHRQAHAIFVFVNDGAFYTRPFNYDPDTDDYPGEDLGNGLHVPSAYFGKVWSENDELADALGHAVSPHARENVDGAMQQFVNGQMIYSQGMVYVAYHDNTWESYPAQSGDSGDFQNDDGDEPQSPPDDSEQTEGATGGASTPASGDGAGGSEPGETEDSENTELQSTPDQDPQDTEESTPELEEPEQTEAGQ